jgi:hypothetical protein
MVIGQSSYESPKPDQAVKNRRMNFLIETRTRKRSRGRVDGLGLHAAHQLETLASRAAPDHRRSKANNAKREQNRCLHETTIVPSHGHWST